MAQSEVITRTSATGLVAFPVTESVRRGEAVSDGTGPTEVLDLGAPDSAAVSFARERALALERSEHSAAVRRLRRAIVIGSCVYVALFSMDVWVMAYTGLDGLPTLLVLRVVGCLLALNALWWLRGCPS